MKVIGVYEGVFASGRFRGAPGSFVEVQSSRKDIPSVGAPFILDELLKRNKHPRYIHLCGVDPMHESHEDVLRLMAALMPWVGVRGTKAVVISSRGDRDTRVVLRHYRQLVTIHVAVPSALDIANSVMCAFEQLGPNDVVELCCRSKDDLRSIDGLLRRISEASACHPVVEIGFSDQSLRSEVLKWAGHRKRYDIRFFLRLEQPIRRSPPPGANGEKQ